MTPEKEFPKVCVYGFFSKLTDILCWDISVDDLKSIRVEKMFKVVNVFNNSVRLFSRLVGWTLFMIFERK